MPATTSDHVISGHITFGSIFQPTSQPSQSVHSMSHPTPMDQAASQPAPTVYPASQPSRSVHSTSHSASTNQDSSQPAPTVQAASRKRSGIALDRRCNRFRRKCQEANEVLNLTCEERIVVYFDYLDEPFGDARRLLWNFSV
ncbi:hypothetical protein K7X08_010634 [Anisodus acutangulus]|uniref:Uncharacterized protein n=1 Tax=Anisodus acutangulus TaxID=402998 RepID=A0A9Q1LYI0_9SOLA|nr:hypothetical protein K7X08_010634 [Anisodus acutangulus]